MKVFIATQFNRNQPELVSPITGTDPMGFINKLANSFQRPYAARSLFTTLLTEMHQTGAAECSTQHMGTDILITIMEV